MPTNKPILIKTRAKEARKGKQELASRLNGGTKYTASRPSETDGGPSHNRHFPLLITLENSPTGQGAQEKESIANAGAIRIIIGVTSGTVPRENIGHQLRADSNSQSFLFSVCTYHGARRGGDGLAAAMTCPLNNHTFQRLGRSRKWRGKPAA